MVIYLGQLKEAFEVIAEHPHKGRDRTVFGAGLRGYSMAEHVIFFREKGASIEIVRVLHKQMDFNRHLTI